MIRSWRQFSGPHVFATALVFLLALMSLPLMATREVLEQAGNIVLVGGDRKRRQLTSSGTDSQPALSGDGKKVVFVRRIDADATEIWTVDVGAKLSARALVKSPLLIALSGRSFPCMYKPRFSPSGDYVYFLVPWAGVTHAILRVAVSKQLPEFIAAAHSLLLWVPASIEDALLPSAAKRSSLPAITIGIGC